MGFFDLMEGYRKSDALVRGGSRSGSLLGPVDEGACSS